MPPRLYSQTAALDSTTLATRRSLLDTNRHCATTACALSWGDDASEQPGELQELMLHETAVAWCRYRFARCVPPRPWLETSADYGRRLKAVVADINRCLDVDQLCRELPSRVSLLLAAEGGRLAK